jgi:hypothetical protein
LDELNENSIFFARLLGCVRISKSVEPMSTASGHGSIFVDVFSGYACTLDCKFIHHYSSIGSHVFIAPLLRLVSALMV